MIVASELKMLLLDTCLFSSIFLLISIGSVQARAVVGLGPLSSLSAPLYRALYLDQEEHSKNPPEPANYDIMKQQPQRVEYVPLKHPEHIKNMRNGRHAENKQKSIAIRYTPSKKVSNRANKVSSMGPTNTNIEDEVLVWTPWSSRSEGPKFKIPPPADGRPVDEKKGKR